MSETITKYICPVCYDQLFITAHQPKPHCKSCGFVCRRTGSSMVPYDQRKARQSIKPVNSLHKAHDIGWDKGQPWGQVRSK